MVPFALAVGCAREGIREHEECCQPAARIEARPVVEHHLAGRSDWIAKASYAIGHFRQLTIG